MAIKYKSIGYKTKAGVGPDRELGAEFKLVVNENALVELINALEQGGLNTTVYKTALGQLRRGTVGSGMREDGWETLTGLGNTPSPEVA